MTIQAVIIVFLLANSALGQKAFLDGTYTFSSIGFYTYQSGPGDMA
jgi:hypothetical protein